MKNKNHAKVIRAIQKRSAIAENIMTYTLEGLLREVEPLFTALYLSAPEESVAILERYPNNSEIRYIVNEVTLYHTDLKLLAKAVAAGFFEYEVTYLLKIATENQIAGARFIPIFCTALAHADELGLSDELRGKLYRHIEHRKKVDGFVITSTDNDCLTLHFGKLA